VDKKKPQRDASEDVALVHGIARGDRVSFETFYDRYSGLLFSTAYKVLNDRTDAEDVTQDVFIQIWDKASLYDSTRGKPLTWAVTMTRNKAIDRLRSLQRRFRLKEDVTRETVPDDFTNTRKPVDEVQQLEQGSLVRDAVMKLTPEQRKVIQMAYFSGLTQSEIAEKLAEPLGTVKARIRRGMMKLKDLLGNRV